MKLTEIYQLNEDVMLEMANFQPRQTGLPTVIWFGEVGGQRGPRIKVSNIPGKFAINDCFTVAVAPSPYVIKKHDVRLSNKELNLVFDWVSINYNKLMLLWQIHETGNDLKHITATGNSKYISAQTIINSV